MNEQSQQDIDDLPDDTLSDVAIEDSLEIMLENAAGDRPDVQGRLAQLQNERETRPRTTGPKAGVPKARRGSSLAPGLRIGMLTVVRENLHEGMFESYSNREWVCKCDCGTEVVEPYLRLYQKTAYSCGCTKKPRKKYYMNLTGQQFGRLLVGDWVTGEGWQCLCECGELEMVRFSRLLERQGDDPCPHS